MGSYTSKLFSHHDDEAKTKSQTNICPSDLQKIKLCTPPITKRKLANDPRSATIGIVRTPIEVTSTPPSLGRRIPNALPKYLQSKRYLETDFDSVLPDTPEKFVSDPRSPNVGQQRTPITVKLVDQYSSSVGSVNPTSAMNRPDKVQTTAALDPRSPATDFDRTPILKPRFTSRSTVASEEVVTLSDVEDGSTKFLYCETTTDYNIPEIQTIADPVVSRIEESSSLENSLSVSEALRDSTLSNSSSEEISACSENDQQITVIHNPAASSLYSAIRSAQTGMKMFCIDDDNDAKADETNDSLDEALDNEIGEIVNAVGKTIGYQKILVSNDKVKVWRDSISPSINDKMKNPGEKVTAGESIVESDGATVTKNPKTTNTVTVMGKIDNDASKNHVRKKFQQQVKSGNKPLIEERENFNNEEKNPVDLSLNRTPLGNRSNNHKQQPRMSTKSPQQLLRNKGLSVQQENTPPTERFVPKTRAHGIQWDPDTTIII